MSATAQCPSCHTRFNVTDAQLSAHDGLVRCGRCQTVFNASEQIELELAKLQLSLPIEESKPTETAAPAQPVAAPSAPPASAELESDHTIHRLDLEENPLILNKNRYLEEVEPIEAASPPARRKAPPGLWIIGIFALLITLAAQGLYAFRTELAAQFPGLKPTLTAYCALLRCTIPLPRKSSLLSIESSDLAADTTHPNIIILSALLHNMAAYPQAFPNVQLSLTDTDDKVLARRLFRPADYLKTEEHEPLGIAGNREVELKLRLDTLDLNPAGYKLLLFYPAE